MTEEEYQRFMAWAQQHTVTTMAGGGIYGGYWSSSAPAYYNPFGQSYPGALAHQAQLAQIAHAAGYAGFDPQPPEPIEDAGISAGEIIAHRAWRTHFGLLQSMAVDKTWSPSEPMEGDPDYMGHGKGVHAFKSQTEALSQYGPERSGWPVVIGTIALWGTVIEHEKGYRAEFGKVNSIDLVIGVGWWRERRMLRRLRRRYGV